MSSVPENVPNTLMLEEIRKEEIPSVGGRGTNPGEMASLGLPVPKAFVVTAQAFRRFLIEANLEGPIVSALRGLDIEDNEAVEAAARGARELVLKAGMPKRIAEDIRVAYRKLVPEPLIVMVRSFVTVQDLPNPSFADQPEIYINTYGEEEVLNAIRQCWASLYDARAISYRTRQGYDDRLVNITVVVQRAVYSEETGAVFTSNRVTDEPSPIAGGSQDCGEPGDAVGRDTPERSPPAAFSLLNALFAVTGRAATPEPTIWDALLQRTLSMIFVLMNILLLIGLARIINALIQEIVGKI
ncbi:MAG: PEP/pyruvate-binding domain-containing protein [Methanospirillum sp.]